MVRRDGMDKSWRKDLQTPRCSVCRKIHAYETTLEICMTCFEYVCPEHKYRHPDCSEGR